MSTQPPPLLIERHAPDLSSAQRRVLDDQWQRFWDVRHNGLGPGNPAFVPAGSLIHHTPYIPSSLAEILRSGVLSGEVGYADKKLFVEDLETHYLADFFRVDHDMTVTQYVEFCHEPVVFGRLLKKRPERYSAPGPRSFSMAFVFPPSRSRWRDAIRTEEPGFRPPPLGQSLIVG